MGSGTSTASLRSSPLGASARTLKSDMINTFQKWETTIESISYVTTKTIAITDPATRPRSQSVSLQIQTQPQPHSTTSTQPTLKNGWTTPDTGHMQGGSDQKEPQRQTA